MRFELNRPSRLHYSQQPQTTVQKRGKTRQTTGSGCGVCFEYQVGASMSPPNLHEPTMAVSDIVVLLTHNFAHRAPICAAVSCCAAGQALIDCTMMAISLRRNDAALRRCSGKAVAHYATDHCAKYKALPNRRHARRRSNSGVRSSSSCGRNSGGCCIAI